ncbi:MAG: hypothetical protein HUU60_07595 [Armatimonadetes bacterium]|nr:hypothetical protein [Armatimonadota bacterium]
MRTTMTVALAALSVATALCQATFAINPRGTFLRTNQDSPLNPLIVSLTSVGLVPGQTIKIETIGDWRAGPQFSDDAYTMIGVFSSSNALLATSEQHRVPDAISTCGLSALSGGTYFGNLPTDIPEDFRISSHSTQVRQIIVRIPHNAAYLFICVPDSLYNDNTDPDGDLAIRISLDAPLPAGDANCDGCVDDTDLALVLTAFGQTGSGLAEDFNGDGLVDDSDLAIVLENFGIGC